MYAVGVLAENAFISHAVVGPDNLDSIRCPKHQENCSMLVPGANRSGLRPQGQHYTMFTERGVGMSPEFNWSGGAFFTLH
jgi:hypothetical protein